MRRVIKSVDLEACSCETSKGDDGGNGETHVEVPTQVTLWNLPRGGTHNNCDRIGIVLGLA
jgi:hypothetical protein